MNAFAPPIPLALPALRAVLATLALVATLPLHASLNHFSQRSAPGISTTLLRPNYSRLSNKCDNTQMELRFNGTCKIMWRNRARATKF